MSRLQLVVAGREYTFSDDQVVAVGRQPKSTVQISDNRVSRNHGELRWNGDNWVYRDLMSSNGSFVDGSRITEVSLTSPVDLRLGDDVDGPLLRLEPEIDERTAPTFLNQGRATISPDEAARLAAQGHLDEPPQVGDPVAPVTPAEPEMTDEHGVVSGPDPSVAVLDPPPAVVAAEPVISPIKDARPLSGHPPVSNAPSDGEHVESPPRFGEASFIHRPDLTLVRIGRSADNDVIVDDLLVSRHHAELRRDGENYALIDLNSHNGTFVNGKKINRAVITSNDYVTIGHHLFRLAKGTLEDYVDTGEITFEALNLNVKTSRDQVLLDDVSFSLGRCTLLAVVGPSGAGKSTLLNALTGFRPADEGTVLYNHRDLYESYDDLRQRIGFVPQDDVLHPQLTVARALEYAAELRFPPDVRTEDRKRRVTEVMDELGLSERADLPIEQLSGGQRKRASIALELITKPSLLFLDEPTSGLDPGYEKTIMTLLRELADGGRTVVVVTHSVQSLDMCDRVLFLSRGGRVAYFGPPREALIYFGQTNYADIFSRLDSEHEVDWKERFRSHPFYEGYVNQPLMGRENMRKNAPRLTLPPEPKQDWMKQFQTLTNRYIDVLRSDRRGLLTLLLQAPILGLLIYAISPRNSFNPSPTIDHSNTTMVALIIVLAVTFMGSVNAIREIVKELPIYRRERAVGLSISAYIASKVVVLGLLTVIQSLVLVIIAAHGQGGPTSSATGIWPGGELVFDVIIAGICSMAIALMISAAVNASDKAMAILPLLLIPQVILSGGVITLNDKTIMRDVSDVVSANWGMAAVGSTIDLNGLDSSPAIGLPQDSRWDRQKSTWTNDIAAMVLLIGAAAAGTWLLLRRRDPFIVRAGPLNAAVGDLMKRTNLEGEFSAVARTAVRRAVQTVSWLAIYGVLHRLG